MTGRSFLIARDDRPGLDRAANALRAWEPHWDLDAPPTQARLYEPDGTLFGFCLGAPMTVLHNHREQSLAIGDIVIVPRDLALDVEPEVVVLALRYGGAPPDHFRERFIQVWGFEHLAAPSAPLRPGDSAEVVPSRDPRYPLTYAVRQGTLLDPTTQATGLESVLLMPLDGPVHVTIISHAQPQSLALGDALLLGPGLEFAVEGEGRIGVVTLFTDWAQEARRNEAARAGVLAGPEFDPGAPRLR